jgi:hypothetical protein
MRIAISNHFSVSEIRKSALIPGDYADGGGRGRIEVSILTTILPSNHPDSRNRGNCSYPSFLIRVRLETVEMLVLSKIATEDLR